MNTEKEKKLLDLFNVLDDIRKDALIMCAEIMSKYSDPVAEAPAPVPVPAPVPAPAPASDPVDVQTSSADRYAVHVSSVGERMEAVAHNADIPKNYQLIVGEMEYLMNLSKLEHNPYNAFCLAFDYGFVKGHRATKRGLVKAM